ncbi:hypothetical protein RHMOL_Rhmol02G0003700 [Rhododendron molle]|uniref:Uncharacterized protein n=1 Tax=Rhododendron molle TaxID=49168 RepID=A0ACC0PLF7_RHOML|nr:hypothetical protein RHMOL_Rhmol02G0003700 [Rhododendron molle]
MIKQTPNGCSCSCLLSRITSLPIPNCRWDGSELLLLCFNYPTAATPGSTQNQQQKQQMPSESERPRENSWDSFHRDLTTRIPPKRQLGQAHMWCQLRVDCIDCAADASVVSAVNEGIEAAREIVPLRRPWVMISVNDDEDLHFRKAECANLIQTIALWIVLDHVRLFVLLMQYHWKVQLVYLRTQGGVITERCYGCGRCLPVCPYDKIRAITYIRDVSATAELLRRDDVDAIEIHTSGRKTEPFKELWTGLGDSMGYVKIVAISLPHIGDSTISSMNMLYSIMQPNLHCFNLWQLDGRPMSGDIGRGATREAISFAVRLASDKDRPLEEGPIPMNSSSSRHALIGGVAYGGYARKIVGRILTSMESQNGLALIEDHPEYLLMALTEALALVGTVKCYDTNLYAS